MLTQDIIKQVRNIIDSGICEPARLHHILSMLEKGRPLYNSDRIYLNKMSKKLEEKMTLLKHENKELKRFIMKQECGLETKNNLELNKSPDELKSNTLIDDQIIDKLLDRQEQMQKKRNRESEILPPRKTANSKFKKLKKDIF